MAVVGEVEYIELGYTGTLEGQSLGGRGLFVGLTWEGTEPFAALGLAVVSP